MADTNGSVEEVKGKTEEKTEKADLNGGGDDAEKKSVEEQKASQPVIELSPEARSKKIKRQIEYYFGDFNLPTDKFLRTEVKENDGWIPLETLLKFKRLALLTQDPAVIVDALAGSELIQINEEKNAVRRHPDKPLPEESEARRKEILTRSLYVKGFPQDNFTIDSALDFFEQYGPTDDVVMRYWQDKATKTWKFKGSVFVKYPTKDAAAAFLALEEVKYEDTPLIRQWQEDFIESKRQERLETKMLKRKRPDDEMSQKSESFGDRGLPKNATLHMTKCPDTLTREMVKEKLEEMGMVVAYIDFNKGDSEGWIRLNEAGSAETVMRECKEGILKLKDNLEVPVKPLEGEEEAKFLEQVKKDISARRAKGGKQHRKGGRGGGRGGRGGGSWRKRKHDNEGRPQAKAAKLEEDSDGE